MFTRRSVLASGISSWLLSPTDASATSSISGPTKSQIGRIRLDPTAINAVFHECRAEYRTRFSGAPFQITNDADLCAILCMLVAHRMAPYGPCYAISLTDLLKAPTLACDNYAGLVGELYDLATIVPVRYPMRMIGFYGGAVGDHAQIFYEGKTKLVLDPTIGVLAKGSYNSILTGKPVKSLLDFYAWANSPADLDKRVNKFFRPKVLSAFLEGKYLPSDALYYFGAVRDWALWDSISPFTPNYASYFSFLTPGGDKERHLARRIRPLVV
jgi:hypothetical protein